MNVNPRIGFTELLNLSVLLLLVYSSCGFVDHTHFLLDLFSHFRVQYLLAAFVLSLLALFFKKWSQFSVFVFCLALNLWALSPYWNLSGAEVAGNAQKLRFISLNLLSSNSNISRTIDWLRNESVDFVVLSEVNSRWHESIISLKDIYPYIVAYPQEDNFGISLLSRHKLKKLDPPGLLDLPKTIVVEAVVNGKRLKVIGGHTVPPINNAMFKKRNSHLRALAKEVDNSSLPTALLGDLNNTMWSKSWRDFIGQSRLVETRLGRGIFATWPSNFPHDFLRIPLDYILFTKNWIVHSLATHKIEGSDHLAIIVDASLLDNEAVVK